MNKLCTYLFSMEARAKRTAEKIAIKEQKDSEKRIRYLYDKIWGKVRDDVKNLGELDGYGDWATSFCNEYGVERYRLNDLQLNKLKEKLEDDGFSNIHIGNRYHLPYIHVNWSIDTCKK